MPDERGPAGPPSREQADLARDRSRAPRAPGTDGVSAAATAPGAGEAGWDFPDEEGWDLAAPLSAHRGEAPQERQASADPAAAPSGQPPTSAALLSWPPWTPDPDGEDAYLDLDQEPPAMSFAGQLASVTTLRWTTSQAVGQADAGDVWVEAGNRVLVEGERTTAVAVVLKRPLRRMTTSRLPRIVRVLGDKPERDPGQGSDWTREAFRYCRERIEQHGLAMKLSRVEQSQGGKKAVFYFSAESRVDFRDLVRDLSRELRVRVELRQVGVRDEAKVTGGVGPCGRELCCSSWIAEFQPVSIRMAKDQNLVLNPGKISGMCSRLKCCLAYEQNLYREGRRHLPRVGETVSTANGPARVIELDIPRQLIRVVGRDGASEVLPAGAVERSGKRGDSGPAAGTPA